MPWELLCLRAMPGGVPDAGGKAVGQACHGGLGWLSLGIPEPSRLVVSSTGSQGEVSTPLPVARAIGQPSALIGTRQLAKFSMFLSLQGAWLPENSE